MGEGERKQLGCVHGNSVGVGRTLAARLFLAGNADAKMDYTNIASVVFSEPTIGTVGLTEVGTFILSAYSLLCSSRTCFISAVVFEKSTLPIRSCVTLMFTANFTQEEAVKRFGKENITVYQAYFTNLYHSLTSRKPKTLMRLVRSHPPREVLSVRQV